MHWTTNAYLFGFVICTIINIIGVLHFKNTKTTIIGIIWECLLIIQLTYYFIQKKKSTTIEYVSGFTPLALDISNSVFLMNNKNCVCLICYKPNDIWIDFLSKFTKYDIYIIIDDNTRDYKEQYSIFSFITIIQINNEECKKNGFINMNFLLRKDITAWEKSIYYFSTINTKYKQVWFFEDDVFFYDEESLLNIDSTYDNSDLLSNSYSENANGSKNDWHWKSIDIKFKPPYYYAMVCCVRVSPNLLCKIKNYANKYHTLFFLEALFPTMCKVNSMKYDTPTEFKNIVYRNDYKDTDIDENNLFHPVKDISKHKYYRDMLKNKVYIE